MRKLKLFFACLLMAVLSIGQVWADDVTIQYTNTSTTTNMTGGNDAATVGLDATHWSVVGAKGGNSNFPGLNKSKYIALYYNATASNTLTVTNLDGATINSIKITYTSNNYNNGKVIVGGSEVTGSSGEYDIDATSFVVTNGNTSNIQVRISKIEITYTPSGGGGSDPTLSLDPSSKEFEATENSAQVIALTASNFSSAVSSVTCAFYSEATCATSISRPSWVNEPTVNGTKTQVSVNVSDNDGAARQTWMKITASDDSDEASAVFAISQKALVVDYATLPFSFTGGRDDIATTSGMTQSGIGTDYGDANAKLKFDHQGDWLIVKFNSAPGKVTYNIKNNTFSGGTFTVQESDDGEIYTDVVNHTAITGTQNEEHNLAQTSRYVKFIYTTKASGNVGIGNIAISEYSTPTTCETPTFTPIAGSYEGAQSVTISCSTAGATIYYTTDGTNPKESATKSEYTSAINVSESKTIKAYAEKDGLLDSEIAEAAYTITTAADVFIDLTDGYWSFPTEDATELTTFTNSETGYAVKCSAANGYKVSGSSYFIIGKQNSYIELPTFSNPIEKIVVVKGGGSSPSGSVVFNIFDGDDAASTAATGCTEDKEFVIENPEGGKTYTLKITSGHNLQLKGFKIYYGEEPTVAKPIISGAEKFVTSTSVSMTCSTTGAEIYYTLDGSDPQISGGTLYEGSFSLTEPGTVNARAKLGSDWSGMVSKTFTKVTPLTTMPEVQAAATTTTDQPITVTINNWVVTAVSGNYVWIADADNAKGILLYKSEHGFTAGKKLNGTVIDTKVKLFNLYPELTSLVASEVTVTDAEDISPRSVTIPTLTSNHPAEQGTIVKLSNVTYSSSDAALSDGVNLIAADNKLYSSLALVDGVTYDITGIVTYYKDGDDPVIKIAPRSATDVEPQSPVVIPTAANIAALKAAARGTYILTLTNAVVTYVNGRNAFIEDATAGALIFIEGHGYNAGDCLNGDYQVTTTDYIGNCEITVIEPQAGATKSTAEIPVTTLTITQLNADYPSYESRRIKIAGVDVTNAIGTSDRNGEISDATNTFAVYAGVANTITLTLGDNVDIIGYPGYNNEAKRLNVWEQSDITVNTKEDPELAYDPETQTITKGDAWTAPAFSNPHSLAVSFESDNESVASVNTSTGVITLGEGTGTAVITAHTDGDATYAAGDATYTITVNPYIPANTDILTAEKIGTTTYADWTQSGFGTTSVYKGNSTTGTGTNAGAIQLRYHATDVTKQAGIVLATSNGLYLRGLSVTVKSGSNTLNVYAKNTAYTDQLDLYSEDEDVRGKLIGTVSSTGAITLEEGVSYDDDYQYIGMRSTGGAIYLTDITVTWGSSTPTPTLDYQRDGLAIGSVGTLCVDHNVASDGIYGATFYQLAGMEGNRVAFDDVTELNAGEPYLFIATASTVGVVYGIETAASPVEVNGMIGTYAGTTVAITEANKRNILYIANNSVYNCANLVAGSLTVPANRCYIDLGLDHTPVAQAPAAGHHRIVLGRDELTGIFDLNTSDAPRKQLINGTIYILRGDKVYDTTGRLVK